MHPVDQSFQYYKYSREGWQSVETRVVSEMNVSLTVNAEVWLSFLCTPNDLEALAVGFLFNEGMIYSRDEIASIHVCEQGDNVDVWLNHGVQKPAHWLRTSGCSGGLTTGNIGNTIGMHLTELNISPNMLLGCMDQLEQAQEVYRKAGGIHCSVLSDGRRAYFQAEDVGRHNTLDKLAGHFLLEPVEISPRIILTTGRVSTEMLTKSQRIGADVVLSRTSPTSRSIQMADQLGIILVGYARHTQMFVYTHAERLVSPGEALPILIKIEEGLDLHSGERF